MTAEKRNGSHKCRGLFTTAGARACHYVGAAILACVAVSALCTAAEPITHGSARFTVLSRTLVRMEYSPQAEFVDRRSCFAINRDAAEPAVSRRKRGELLILDTGRQRVRHRADGKPFHPGNLDVFIRDDEREITWTPRSEQTGNLGGTLRTLDGVDGPRDLGEGLLSRDGWYLFEDTTPLLTAAPDTWPVPRQATGHVDWYLFGYGSDYAKALKDLTTVAGKVPLPPRYTLGVWYSRWWPYSSDDYRQLVREFDRHRFPLDVMVMDMDWHLKGWTGYTWNRELIPDPESLLSWFHEQGLHVTLNVHPHQGVGDHERAFEQFAENLGLDPADTERIPFDVTDRDYMRNYFRLLHHPLEEQGVDFWWVDWQQGTRTDVPGLDPLQWLNFQHFRDRGRPGSGGRGHLYSRWAGWGDHRHPVHFSGDARSSWAVLDFLVPFTATASNVGCFYWIHDTGGFAGPVPTDELLTRWVQFSAVSAALKTHAARGNPENVRRPWLFGDSAEAACRRAYALRSRLFPYIYSSAWLGYAEAAPLIRPMYYQYPRSEVAHQCKGQYFFGPDILVAPVTRPGEGGTSLAPVHVWFPPGTWYHLLTGERVEGGGYATIWSTLSEFPIFVRGATPLPMRETTLRMSSSSADPLVVQVFPGTSGRFVLYEDQGESAHYKEGGRALTPLTYDRSGNTATLDIGPTQGRYEGQAETRTVQVRLAGMTAEDIRLNGENLAGSDDVRIDADKLTTEIRLSRRSIRTRLRLEFQVMRNAGEHARRSLAQRLRRAHAALPEAAPGVRARVGRLQQELKDLAAGRLSLGDSIKKTERLSRKMNDVAAAWLQSDHAGQRVAAHVLLDVGLKTEISDDGECVEAELLLVPGANTRIGPTDFALRRETAAELQPDARRRQAALRNRTHAARFRFDGLGVDRIGRWRPEVVVSTEIDERNVNFSRRLDIDRRFLSHWLVAGPFPGGDNPNAVPVGPELSGRVDPGASYTGKGGERIGWRCVRGPALVRRRGGERVDATRLFKRQRNAALFAVTYLHASTETNVHADVRSDDGIVIWVNGRREHVFAGRRGLQEGLDSVEFTARKGWNEVLLKLGQGKGGWAFSILAAPEDDGAVLRQSAVRPAELPHVDTIAPPDLPAFAEESFTYPGENLTHADGGAGWAGSWTGHEQRLLTPGMHYTDSEGNRLATAGKRLRLTGSPAQSALSYRALSGLKGVSTRKRRIGAEGSTVWLSFLARTPDVKQGQWGGLSLFDQAAARAERVFLGVPYNKKTWGLHLFGAGEGGRMLVTEVPAAKRVFVVMRLDFRPGKERLSLWLDPSLASVPAHGTQTLTAEVTDFRLDRIRVGGTLPMDLDEVRIGPAYRDVAPLSVK